jgi:hypothetical protein
VWLLSESSWRRRPAAEKGCWVWLIVMVSMLCLMTRLDLALWDQWGFQWAMYFGPEVRSKTGHPYLYIGHGELVNMMSILTMLESELYADSGRSC